MKATAMCIIAKPNYTRCLLNTREEAESNGFFLENFPNAVLINIDSYVLHP